MKKTKLLAPILGFASIATVAIPLTSCKKDETVKLTSISIKTQATTKDFNVGDTFSSAGLVITAKYSDNTTKSVSSGASGLTTNYDGKTFSDADVGNDKTVTVSYKDNGVTKSTSYKINVNSATAALISIAVTTQPTKKDFVAQQTFSSAGLVITATYADGTTEEVSSGATGLVTDYDNKTFTEDDVANEKLVTITYTKGSVSKIATYKINVTSAIFKLVKPESNEQSWYDTGDAVTLYPDITYKAIIENIAAGDELNTMLIMDEQATPYEFAYIIGSAKNAGVPIEGASFSETPCCMVTWPNPITTGSFEISFTVPSDTTALITVMLQDLQQN